MGRFPFPKTVVNLIKTLFYDSIYIVIKRRIVNMKKIPTKINKLLEKFTKDVNDIFGDRAKKIILYGSYARGDFNKNSDIDIMILTDLKNDEIPEFQDKIWDCAYDIEAENNIIVSVLVKNIDRFNYWLEALPFYMNVQKEGVVLNG
jgi:predicted nucleotidyltransferase